MTCTDTHTVVAGRDIGLVGPLRVEILPDGRRARLLQPFRVQAPQVADGFIEAPQGFETDFASVPRVLWRIVPPWGRYSPAAVIHDYLYFTGQVPRVPMSVLDAIVRLNSV